MKLVKAILSRSLNHPVGKKCREDPAVSAPFLRKRLSIDTWNILIVKKTLVVFSSTLLFGREFLLQEKEKIIFP